MFWILQEENFVLCVTFILRRKNVKIIRKLKLNSWLKYDKIKEFKKSKWVIHQIRKINRNMQLEKGLMFFSWYWLKNKNAEKIDKPFQRLEGNWMNHFEVESGFELVLFRKLRRDQVVRGRRSLDLRNVKIFDFFQAFEFWWNDVTTTLEMKTRKINLKKLFKEF